MVPVPDVLRHIATRLQNSHGDDQTLIRFLADMQEKRLRLYHPSNHLLEMVASLPCTQADFLFLASYDKAAEKYCGRFHWFANRERTIADCQAVQERLDELMHSPGWEDFGGDIDQLPWPTSRLIGGLLVCRNGNGWITLAVIPTSLPPTVGLLHLVQAIPVTLVDLILHPEEINMSQAHPMIDQALKTVQRITEPRRNILLSSFFDQLQRRRLHLVGAMPGEEEAFFSPENNLEVVYGLATRLYREGADDRLGFWTAWEEFSPHDETLGHIIEERLVRFLKRRRSIFPDADFPRFSSKVALPEGSVHAGWIITCHPHDGLQTRLFVTRGFDPKIGLCCLEEATYRAYLWH